MSKLLERDDSLVERDIHELAQLELRVRIGCKTHGVRLFYPKSSGLSRHEINALVEAGHTASSILSKRLQIPPLEIDDQKWNKLRTDLEENLSSQFKWLAAEWTRGTEDAQDNQITKLWNTICEDVFPISLMQFGKATIREKSPPLHLREAFCHFAESTSAPLWSIETHEEIRPIIRKGSPVVASDEIPNSKPMVRLVPGPGCTGRWIFQDMSHNDGTLFDGVVDLLPIEVHHSGSVKWKNNAWTSIDELVDSELSGESVAVVPFPFMPSDNHQLWKNLNERYYSRGSRGSLIIVSPAAFLILTSMLARGFVDDHQRVYELLTDSVGPELITCKSLLSWGQFDFSNVPQLLETLVTVFEVD